MDKAPYIIGSPEEWRIFAEEHPVFMQRLPKLNETINNVVARQNAHTPKPIDRVMITFGWVCAHDFNEILVLCGNGHGVGGLKLLRGMYERAVTAQYIYAFPDTVQKFFDYNAIHFGKLLNHTQDISIKLSPEREAEIKKARKEAETRFQEKLCEQCGTTRTQMSWSGQDLKSMAIKARKQLKLNKDEGLDALYSVCYYIPTMHTHPTFFSFNEWVEFSDEGMEWNVDAQRRVSTQAIRGAHLVMMHVLKTQNDYFELHLDNELNERQEDLIASWQAQ